MRRRPHSYGLQLVRVHQLVTHSAKSPGFFVGSSPVWVPAAPLVEMVRRSCPQAASSIALAGVARTCNFQPLSSCGHDVTFKRPPRDFSARPVHCKTGEWCAVLARDRHTYGHARHSPMPQWESENSLQLDACLVGQPSGVPLRQLGGASRGRGLLMHDCVSACPGAQLTANIGQSCICACQGFQTLQCATSLSIEIPQNLKSMLFPISSPPIASRLTLILSVPDTLATPYHCFGPG